MEGFGGASWGRDVCREFSWLKAPAAGADFAGAVSVTLWNYMGWDNASTVAQEVEEPQRNYPRAMLAAAGLVALTYVLAAGGGGAGGDSGRTVFYGGVDGCGARGGGARGWRCAWCWVERSMDLGCSMR